MKYALLPLFLIANLFILGQEVTLHPTSLKQISQSADSVTIAAGLKAGWLDTTVKTPSFYKLVPQTFAVSAQKKCSPTEQLIEYRNYLFKTIAAPAFEKQLPGNKVFTEDKDSVFAKFERLEYAGNCAEHCNAVQRLLEPKFKVISYSLNKSDGAPIDHTLNFVYWTERGRLYGVVFDSFLGHLFPLNDFGRIPSIDSIKLDCIDTPAIMNSKRYCIDVATHPNNLFINPKTTLYSQNGYVYHYYYDDISVYAPEKLILKKENRNSLMDDYQSYLITKLIESAPQSAPEFKWCLKYLLNNPAKTYK